MFNGCGALKPTTARNHERRNQQTGKESETYHIQGEKKSIQGISSAPAKG